MAYGGTSGMRRGLCAETSMTSTALPAITVAMAASATRLPVEAVRLRVAPLIEPSLKSGDHLHIR